MRFDSLIDAVLTAFQQELDLLEILSDEVYTTPSNAPYPSSVGMHLRHNLDHFEAFFTGLGSGRIDYESRSRNTMIEASPEIARSALNGYVEKLEALRSAETLSLQVREESDAGVDACEWLASSIGRELQFLLGHTVHHNAIIAMMVNAHGIDLPASFGVAPSTQRHEGNCRPASS